MFYYDYVKYFLLYLRDVLKDNWRRDIKISTQQNNFSSCLVFQFMHSYKTFPSVPSVSQQNMKTQCHRSRLWRFSF